MTWDLGIAQHYPRWPVASACSSSSSNHPKGSAPTVLEAGALHIVLPVADSDQFAQHDSQGALVARRDP